MGLFQAYLNPLSLCLLTKLENLSLSLFLILTADLILFIYFGIVQTMAFLISAGLHL